jgi:hypothetical protein
MLLILALIVAGVIAVGAIIFAGFVFFAKEPPVEVHDRDGFPSPPPNRDRN